MIRYSEAMQRIWIILPFLICVLAAAAAAGEIRQIELTDGSVLTGEVLSYQNGTYTVRTDALGTVTIHDARIRSIRRHGDASPAAPAAPAAMGQARSLQEQMQSDEQVMEMVRALKDDPAFREALENPEILRAVESGDMAALMSNPDFLQLLNNSKIMEIKKKMGN